MTALDPGDAPRDPAHCADVIRRVRRYLEVEQGVVVRYRPQECLADWDVASRTLTVRRGALMADHLWVLLEVWKLLVIGPAACPDAEPVYRPQLQLIV